MKDETHYVYILHCENNSYYTGYTNDVEKRFLAHISGKASKYTNAFKPTCILQQWAFNDKSTAMRAEYWIKKLTRKKKEELIACPSLLHKVLL